jgi:hypothetical protein
MMGENFLSWKLNKVLNGLNHLGEGRELLVFSAEVI